MMLPLRDTSLPSSNLKLCMLTFIPVSLLTEAYPSCSPWCVRMKAMEFSQHVLPRPSMEDDQHVDFRSSFLYEGCY